MAASRCSKCRIDYPVYVKICRVDNCGNELEPVPVQHMEDWDDQVLYMNTLIEKGIVIPPTLPDVQYNVAEFRGVLWIPHQTLLDHGYLCLEDFDVIRIRGRYYELCAHVGRTLTHGIKGGAWWIEEIDPARFEIPDSIPEEVTTHGEEQDAV